MHRNVNQLSGTIGRASVDGRPGHTFISVQKTQRETQTALEDMVCQISLPDVKILFIGTLRFLPGFRLFDVSKQIVGQMFVHGVNVFISDLGSHHSAGNACVYYFLNILIDTTIGKSLPFHY